MAKLNPGKIREVFDEVAELEPSERAARLEKICGGDAELRAEVERLLQALQDAGDFIERPALASFDRASEEPTRELTLEMAGQRIGQYRVLRELGRGGMGIVYLAERADGEFRKQVAIKLIASTANEQIKQRFRRERQILADLDHPNIARLLDGGTLDGQPFVVMEFVPGQSLRERLRERGALPIEEISAIVQQVCAGLADAHDLGVVHRDIKPENLIVAERHGQLHVTILDFGIAKLQQSQNTTSQTQNALILGTPSYMSPEQAAGAGFAEIDKRADIYSLGMVIYEMLTGKPAFQGDSFMTVLYQHQHVRPTPPHETKSGVMISPAVSAVVMKALAKEPAERQQTAKQLADEFALALQSGKTPEPAWQWRKAALATVVVIALALSVWAIVMLGKNSVESLATTASQEKLANAYDSTKLQYRILKKDQAGKVTLLEAHDSVQAGNAIRFEFLLPFPASCYVFFRSSRDGTLVWINPNPKQPPQHANAKDSMVVPQNTWIPYENDDGTGQQTFLVVYVPDDFRWDLLDVVPASEVESGLKVVSWDLVNITYVRIFAKSTERLLKELKEKALPASFSDSPVAGTYLADVPTADGRKVIFHEITFIHEKSR